MEWFAVRGPRSEDPQEHNETPGVKIPGQMCPAECHFIFRADKGSPLYGPNIIWVKSTLIEKRVSKGIPQSFSTLSWAAWGGVRKESVQQTDEDGAKGRCDLYTQT